MSKPPFRPLPHATLLAGLALSGTAMATAQIPDRIRIGTAQEALFAHPLGPQLKKPEVWERLAPLLSASCSASWRGYMADWELREDKLYLVALHVDPCNREPRAVPLDTLLPGSTGPVHASWFSGRLVIPRGKEIEYVHMGYESRFERYLLIEVRDGAVVTQTETDSLPADR